MLIKKAKLKTSGFAEPEIRIDVDQLSSDINHMQDLEIPQNLVQERIEVLVKEQEERLVQKEERAEREIAAKIQEAQAEANKIIQEAEVQKAESEKSIEEAKAKLEAETETLKAHINSEKQKGYEEGFKEGEELTSEFKAILATFQNTKADIMHEAKNEIAAIAIDVTKQLIKKEVAKGSSILKDQINDAIKKVVRGKGKVQIHVSPLDLASARDLEPKLMKTLDPAIKLVFSEDERIIPGSCIIETKGGKFDANFSTQLKTIQTAFSNYLNYQVEDLPQEELKGNKEREEEKMPAKKNKSTTAKKTTTSKKTSKASSSKNKVVATMKTSSTKSTAKKTTSKGSAATKKKDQIENEVLDDELEALLEAFDMPEDETDPAELAKLFTDDDDSEIEKITKDADIPTVATAVQAEVVPESPEDLDEYGIPISKEEKIIKHDEDRVVDFDYDDTLDDYKTRTYKDYEGTGFDEDDNEFDPGHFRQHHEEDEEPPEDGHFKEAYDDYVPGDEILPKDIN